MGQSSRNKMHVVSFNIPYPADNGGLIDICCKLKALKQAGASILLHCYEYGRPHAPELTEYCEKVFYYPRNTGKAGLFNTLPYIVYSRRSKELTERLAEDEFPVLLEGLHCCGILENPLLKNKRLFVRTHNIEHDYYRGLAVVEKNLFKRYYFNNEAKKLESFEHIITSSDGVFAISKEDAEYFQGKYPGTKTWNIPAFHLNDKVTSRFGKGDFALYHGSLDVGENDHAALQLANEVFNDLPFHLIIAGKNPSKQLRQSVTKYPNIELRSNPSTQELQQLVQNAHINVLPAAQSTGIKLKLLLSLFAGRHCLVNDLMVKGTGLETLCHIENSAAGMKTEVKRLFETSFSDQQIATRREVLERDFSNSRNAEMIMQALF